jgi:hypothetical protein
MKAEPDLAAATEWMVVALGSGEEAAAHRRVVHGGLNEEIMITIRDKNFASEKVPVIRAQF